MIHKNLQHGAAADLENWITDGKLTPIHACAWWPQLLASALPLLHHNCYKHLGMAIMYPEVIVCISSSKALIVTCAYEQPSGALEQVAAGPTRLHFSV